MIRFAFFVDGSNLFGSLKGMGIRVDDYQSFYNFVFKSAVSSWREATQSEERCVLQRVYWYQLGSIDEWDLDDSQSQAYLRDRFDAYKALKAGYMAEAGKANPGEDQDEVARKAWVNCFDEMKEWYQGKRESIASLKRFHHGVMSSTDCIDILEVGHWKVDFFAKKCDEKGLDTRLAVDMVALEDNYDVGIVISGDADSIPSIDLLKKRNKHVGAVEFIRGYPPEKRGKGFSSKIKLSADFVAPIYEMEVVRRGVGYK